MAIGGSGHQPVPRAPSGDDLQPAAAQVAHACGSSAGTGVRVDFPRINGGGNSQDSSLSRAFAPNRAVRVVIGPISEQEFRPAICSSRPLDLSLLLSGSASFPTRARDRNVWMGV